jgi:hypothetical protein
MDYAPDVWVIVEISGNKVEKSPYHRVLAGWYGGFAGSDSWKMNSGITEIIDKGNWYEIHGDSGSIYNCGKSAERMSSYTAGIFQSYAAENSDDISLKIVDIADVLERYTNEPIEPPLSNEEATAKIQKAAAEGRITYAETLDIEDYEDIAREFLKNMFDIEYDECFISDESTLSDFASCCVPNDVAIETFTLQEYYSIGREHMVKKIEETYGLTVQPWDYLVTVFSRIRYQRIAHLH